MAPGSANSSPQGHGRPKVQEMEQLLDAEMGSKPMSAR